MPFHDPPISTPTISGEAGWRGLDDRAPEILLRRVGPATFQMLRGFEYQRPGNGTTYTINPHDLTAPPQGNSTDFASVPSLFWWLIASYGNQTRAAIIHDQLYDDDVTDTEVANKVFHEALAESGVPFLRGWIMWAGVDIGGRWRSSWARKLGVLLELATVLLFILGIVYWAVAQLWGWWPLSGEPFDHFWLLPVASAVVGAAIWRARWFVAALAFSLLMAPALPQLVSRCVLYGLDWICFKLHLGAIPSPKPTFGPPRISR